MVIIVELKRYDRVKITRFGIWFNREGIVLRPDQGNGRAVVRIVGTRTMDLFLPGELEFIDGIDDI